MNGDILLQPCIKILKVDDREPGITRKTETEMRESVCSRSNFFRSPREHNTKEIELGMLSTYVLNFLTYKTNASDIFAIALQEKST